MTSGLRIKQRERSRFFFFVAVNLLMNVGLTIGQSVSEGLFLSNDKLGPARLAQAFVFTAVATAIATFVYASFVDKVRNDRYFQIIHAYSIGALCLILVGIWHGVTLATMALYGFFYVTQGIFNTHFWNYATDYFDTVEAKRLFPFFPLGNSIGGFIGGSFTWLLGETVPPLLLATGWVLFLAVTWVLIRVVSPQLKGWVVMEAQESDETSLANVRQGFLFLRRSVMGRWHIAYAFIMITCLFFLQYLYSDLFHQAYPDAEQLTAFIGRFLAITNVIEIVLELTFTPRLIAIAGVGAANVFYPLSTLAGFVLTGAFRNLPVAVYSRMNRETFENAISASCRNLLYNAYPSRFRGRIRAFIEGAVPNAGIVIVGLVMMGLGRVVAPEQLFTVVIWTGSALSLGFLFIAACMRRQYLDSLVRGLKDYRLDLDDVSLEIEKVKDEDLLEVLSLVETRDDEASVRLILRIMDVLLSRGATEPVMARLQHAKPPVQSAAMEALRKRLDADPNKRLPQDMVDRLTEELAGVLDGGRADVRARAVDLLGRLPDPSRIASRLDDRSPEVRAAAAAALIRHPSWNLPTPAWQVLEEMLSSDDVAVRAAGLRRLPMEAERSTALALQHISDSSDDVRLAVVDRLAEADEGARMPSTDGGGISRSLQPLLSDANEDVRAGVVRLLGLTRDEAVLPMLAARLEDGSVHVRREAIEALRHWKLSAMPHVRPLLEANSSDSVDAALAVLGGMEKAEARNQVRQWLVKLLREAHDVVIAHAVMTATMLDVTRSLDEHPAEDVDRAFRPTEPLAIAMLDFVARVRRHVLSALESLEDPTVIRNIRRCLEMRHRQARGDAMEALSSLREKEIAHGLLLLLDDGSEQERLRASLTYRHLDKAPPWKDLLLALRRHSDRWIRAASAALAEQTARGPTLPGAAVRQTEEYAVMKSLLFMKKVPLFAQMSLEQLEIISRIVTELSFFKGEVIFKENDIGDRLYIIVEGKVDVVKNFRSQGEVKLATLKETDHFGEMSALDNQPRSATIVVEEDSRLLSISGEKLRDVIHQKPEIAFEIFKVLSSRLRLADNNISDLTRENNRLRTETEAAVAASRGLTPSASA